MDLFPTALGTRPRLACELRPEALVLARGESPSGLLTAVTRVPLAAGLIEPSLRPGNLASRTPLVAALRRALDTLSTRGGNPRGQGKGQDRYLTLILPDSCVRVLLLDFDALPSKPAEALPLVRFRLKKLLPFDVDQALVSYQVMSTERSVLRVLAVAIPLEVLAEYEAVITEAGLQPGAVLPSTLAALAGLDPTDSTALVINSAASSLTSAIVRAGVLLLHRTVDLTAAPAAAPFPSELPPQTDLSNFGDPSAELGVASAFPSQADAAVALLNLAPELNNPARDLAETVSVASAYFEDTLGEPAAILLSAGTTSAQAVRSTLLDHGFDSLEVRELLDPAAFGPGVSPDGALSPGWLAGVRGALRS